MFNSDVKLLKLYGSVDWRVQSASRGQERPGAFARPTYSTAADPYTDQRTPLVVFGAGEKLRSDGPFLDLFMEAKQSLAEADELVVVGCSFRDDHVNDLISNWVSTSPTRTILIVAGPNFPKKLDGRFQRLRQGSLHSASGLLSQVEEQASSVR